MKHFLIGILVCLPALLWAQPQQIISPDGQLVVNIDLNGGGTPIYNVYYKGQCFLKDSPLGLRTNLGDFTRNISFWKAGEAEAVARDYTLRNIKKSVVAYRANRRDFAFYQQRKNREGKEGKVHVMDHPLVAHKLTIRRDKDTSVKDFREIVSEIGMLITYEATRDLPLTTKEVETPICRTIAPTLKGKKFAVVPILRAGLGLVDGVLRMVPSARVGHIGMYRDEETLEPHPYFCKMPKDVAERDVMIVDPMLATGGSACEAIGEMVKRGCKHITLMVLVAAPEGIKAVQEKYPDVNIYAGALDDHLNEHGYIVPGLGDAGDRIFCTK